MGGVTSGPSDPWGPWDDPADAPAGDVLEGGLRPPWWRRGWTALPRTARLLVIGLVLAVAVGALGLELRERAAERALARQVALAASVGLSSISTTPPGGQVSFFVVVRNEGARSVRITGLEGWAGGLRLRMQDDVERRVSPDGETAVPVSVRLTCPDYAGGQGLTTAIAVRREDGGAATRRVRPDPADLLLDVATTLCGSRPDLRDQEISGPVLDQLADDGPDR
jgi:hypothetical protein